MRRQHLLPRRHFLFFSRSPPKGKVFPCTKPRKMLFRKAVFFRDPCARCCRIAPCVTFFHSSIRAPLQHTEGDCLVLLPSDPDTVHRLLLRKTRTSSPLPKGRPSSHTSKASITLTIADCEYRAPLPPRLARKFERRKRTVFHKVIHAIISASFSPVNGNLRRRAQIGRQKIFLRESRSVAHTDIVSL